MTNIASESASRSPESSISSEKPTNRSWTGIVFGFLAAIITSFGSIMLKITDENKVIVILLRMLFQFIVLLPVVQILKIEYSGPNIKINLLLVLRGVLSPCVTICLALALTYLPLGDSTAIFYTNPVFTVFFACLCLKETCTILNIVLTIITMGGFLLVSQPAFIFGGPEDDPMHFHYPYRVVGSLLALSGAIMASVAVITVRKLGPGVHFSLSMLYAGLEGTIVVLIYIGIARLNPIPCFHSLPLMFGCSICYFVGQIFRTLALQREKAGTISLIQSSQVIFSFVLQYIFLNEVPNALGGIGAGLIFLSCVVLAVKSIVKAVK